MDQIATRSFFRKKGYDAALRGAGREDHNMNWFAPALPEWYAGYDLAKAEQARAISHNAPAGRACVELAQVGA